MFIIPAIDIMDGEVVRLEKGDFNKKIYYGKPSEFAKKFKDEGAKRIHVVDLDGAKSGRITNWEAIREISQIKGLKIEVGGGIREESDLERLFEIGVNYTVLSSRALIDEIWLMEVVKKYKERIILSLDIYNEKIMIKGWKESVDLDLKETLKKLNSFKIREIIFTNIAKDGTLEGIVISFVEEIVEETRNYDFDLIYSGGIASINDLIKLKSLGIKKVIIGKAIYEDKISLKDALRV
jgi:phosphoribosylformimino-5-aminoimidazole carboxamide ribotide isomerase